MDSNSTGPTFTPARARPITKVLVATTAMLAFISFWRAAAIVLNDLASSAYYAGGEAEQFIGKTAPWFILGIMLFSYAVRAIYVESCSMFVRGGVYRVVKEALGGTLAKFSVSALMFDYVLTGPISGVSAGQYLVGVINELFHHAGTTLHLNVDATAATVAIMITLYFWWENIKGVPESSGKALRIMQLTTIMVVVLISWCFYTLWVRSGWSLPPLPNAHNMKLDRGSLGWLDRYQWAHTITLIIIFVGLGHSVLAMSGEESLAQVYREIEHPKLKNLKKAGLVIFIYSLVFTSLVSFFAVMIIPDSVRGNFTENLIGGLAMHLVGRFPVRLSFHVFVVVVGTLILAGAVNTAIVGSNGVLNRVSEDGVLTDWFRHPHPRFGTTHRIINLVVAFQIVTIIASRGDVTFLGNLYAFGVIWSFSMKGIAVLVLRYTHPQDREYRVPLNPVIFGKEIPHRPGADHAGAGGHRDHQLVHEAASNDCRHHFHDFAVHGVRSFRASHARTRRGRRSRGTRPIQSRAGSRTDAHQRGRRAGKHSGAGEHVLRAVPSGSGAAAGAAKRSGNCSVARADAAPRCLWRIRSRSGPAFQHHRATAFHQSAWRSRKKRANRCGWPWPRRTICGKAFCALR